MQNALTWFAVVLCLAFSISLLVPPSLGWKTKTTEEKDAVKFLFKVLVVCSMVIIVGVHWIFDAR